MNLFKKVTAVLLTVLICFSCVSVCASAAIGDGRAQSLQIKTEILRKIDGVWTATEKVAPGEQVKARVYLDTDYYANGGELLFFYGSDFFVDTYATNWDLVVNDAEGSFTKTYGVYGYVSKNGAAAADMVAEGYITQDFVDTHKSFAVRYNFGIGVTNQLITSGDDWFCEFDLIVRPDATGEDDFFAVDETVSTTDNIYGFINVPKGTSTSTSLNSVGMWNWNEASDKNVVLLSTPVSVMSTATFNTGDGAFADGTTQNVQTGLVKTDVDLAAVGTPDREGYNFLGWVDASIANPKATDVLNTITFGYTDSVYNAFWKLTTSSITFDANGGTFPSTGVGSYTEDKVCGEAFEAPEDPVLEGSTFMGWSPVLPETNPDEDTTYTAIWQDTIVVSFDTDGGTEIAEMVGVEGAPLTIPEAPTKKGYYFAGWEPALTDVFPAKSTVYKAIWEETVYSVNYYVNGTYVGSLETEYGDTIVTDPGLYVAPEGYTLSVWYTDAGYIGELEDGAVMDTESIDLFAKTTANVYDAVFYVDGDVYATVPTAYDDDIVAPADPVKEGFRFTGWTPAVTVMDDVNGKAFTATWVEDTFAITYYVDGEVYDTIADEFGAEVDAPVEPVKEGYTFVGWATKGETENTFLPATMPAEDLEFDAIFEINKYTITFDTDGGTTITPITQDFASDITAPENPEKEGYTFGGWVDADGNPVEIPATMPADDMTIFADFTINTYTFTWSVDGSDTEVPYEFGADVEKVDDPEKEGHTFTGWDITIPATMPAEDVKAVAQFTANTYNAIFMVDGTVYSIVPTVYGNVPAKPYVDPVKTGYTFAGWSPELSEIGAEDAIYNATFTANNYDAIFDANGGSFEDGTTENKTVSTAFGEIPVAPENLSKTGYTFAGWTPSLVAMTVNGAYYTAVWTNSDNIKYVVEIYQMGTDGNYTEDPTYTETYTGTTGAPVAYTPEEIEGFTADLPASTLTGYIAADGSLVLAAYYTRNTYTFTTDVEGTLTSTDYYFEATVAAPATPVKTGFTFAGWTPDVPATMPAEDVTVVAKFTRDIYTATFYVDGDIYAVLPTDYDAVITIPEYTAPYGYTVSDWSPAVPEKMPAEDMNFYAETAPGVFDAVFMVDGEVYETVPTKFDDFVAPPEAPEKEGYTFIMWDPDIPDDTTICMDSEDGMIFDAIFDPNEYTLTFDANNGSEPVEIPAIYDEGYDVPATPEKEGYDFAGWFDEDGNPADGVVPSADTTYTAKWDVQSYTVTWLVDGNATVVDYEYGQAIIVPEIPAKTGHTTAGWYTLAGSAAVIPATMPADDLVYTAKYDLNSYKATYYNGTEQVAQYTIAYGASVGKPTDPEKVGYTFTGWSPEVPATMPAEDVDFYAQYDANTNTEYTVETYEMDLDGNYPDEPTRTRVETGTTGTTATATYALLTGFSVDEEKSVFNGTIAPDGSLVLKVYFSRNKYNVYYKTDKDGNGEYETVDATFTDVYFGAEIPTTDVIPEIIGKTFIGWSPSAPETMPARDVTFVSTWQGDIFTFTYIIDGEANSVGYLYDEEIEVPANPELLGYEFLHWSLTEDGEAYEIPETMPNENITVYAVFKQTNFTVYYLINEDDAVEDAFFSEVAVGGADVPAPDADPEDIYAADGTHVIYTFEGWVDADGNEAPETMPMADLYLYASYKKVAVKLIPAAGMTTVVDRNGYTETIADFDGVAGTDYTAYEDSTDTEKAKWFVYGLAERLNKNRLLGYVDYTGDGRIELVPCTVLGGTADGYGTGAVINLYDVNGTPDDTSDDVLVESFYVVVFGDVNGDARITNTDVTLTDTEVAGASEERWGRGQVAYRFKAGNINGDSRITNTDASMIASVVAGASTIDQTTCGVTTN